MPKEDRTLSSIPRRRIAPIAIAASFVASLALTAPASADLPLPPLPDTTCLTTSLLTTGLECPVSTVQDTLTTLTSQVPGLPTGTTGTTVSGGSPTPYSSGGTVQQGSGSHPIVRQTKTKRHYSRHRGGHRHRRGYH